MTALRSPAMDFLAGVEPVEHGRLLVDRGLGGVEVLGRDPVVVEQPPRPEPHRVAGDVADRPDQPPAEPVVEPAAAPPGQAAEGDLLVGEALGPQVPRQLLATARGEPDAELLGRLAVEPALAQEVAARPGLGGVEQGVVVELLRHPVRLDQPRAPPEGLAVARACRPPRSAAPCRASGRAARSASVKVRCSTFWTNEMTSPPSPQPKQCQAPTAGRTLNDGDFSSWKGHRPFIEPGPAGRRVTCSRTTSSMDERSLTSATSSALIRPATGPPCRR